MKINEVFTSIQGEGKHTGTPAVFVRFSGCNLDCSWCDTDHEKGYEFTIDQLYNNIRKRLNHYPHVNHIVFTGGEPCLQKELPELIGLFNPRYITIQIETNGTISMGGWPWSACWITCSPKAHHPVAVPTCNYISEWKYIVTACNCKDGIPLNVTEPPSFAYVSLQPCHTGKEIRDRQLVQYTFSQCLKYGYHFSAQLHKLCNFR